MEVAMKSLQERERGVNWMSVVVVGFNEEEYVGRKLCWWASAVAGKEERAEGAVWRGCRGWKAL